MTNREKLNKMCISDILKGISKNSMNCPIVLMERVLRNDKFYRPLLMCDGNCDECIQKWLNTKRG